LFASALPGADLTAMSADILLTSNSKAGSVVTHEPGADLHVYE
jgi:hypothetical protein